MKNCIVLFLVLQFTVVVNLLSQCQFSGRVWHDGNANGIRESNENWVEDVVIDLLNADTTVALDILGNSISSSVSDMNGNYGFTNLEPQSYLLRVNQGTAWYFSPLNIGSDAAVDNDYDENGYLVKECTDVEVALFLDCGLYKNLTVGGTIWVEGDDNGNQDAGENGAAGVEVEILNAAGSVVGTDITDPNGDYSFNVQPGYYTIQVTTTPFASGGQLYGLISCTPTSDANNDVDMDDNGDGTNVGTIVTTQIELICGGEPGGVDFNENFTIDFCFKYDCNSTNTLAALSCESVQDIICDLTLLDVACARMPDVLVAPFPTPLCSSGGQAHNMSWFAFVAGNGTYTLQVEPYECTPGAGGEVGVQAGVYTDCSFNDAVFCQTFCTTNPIDIPSSALIPGKVYYFFFDGCAGSVCSYNINIIGNYEIYQIPIPDSILCLGPNCDLYKPGEPMYFKLDESFDDLIGTYLWTITTPSGDVEQLTSTNYLEFIPTTFGEYIVTLAYIMTNCSYLNTPVSYTFTINCGIQDEDFGKVSICENDLLAYLGPNSINDEGQIFDPNGDGINGWVSNGSGLNVGVNTNKVTLVDGCFYHQTVEIELYKNSEELVNFVYCEDQTLLPISVFNDSFFVADFNIPLQLFDENANGCDSSLTLKSYLLQEDLKIYVLPCDSGYVTIGLDTDIPELSGSNMSYIWSREDLLPIEDKNTDSLSKTIEVNIGGYYHLEVHTVIGADTCVQIYDSILVEDVSLIEILVDSLIPITSGESGFIGVSVISGSNLNYAWTGPQGFSSTSQDIYVVIPGCYVLTVSNEYCAGSKTICIDKVTANTNIIQDKYEIWPNPAHDKIYLNHVNQLSKIQLYQTDGRLIGEWNEKVIQGKIIDIKNIENGLYFLSLFYTDGSTTLPITILK